MYGCNSYEVKNEFYRELSWSLNSVYSTDVVFVAGDFGAQFSYLMETERYIGG